MRILGEFGDGLFRKEILEEFEPFITDKMLLELEQVLRDECKTFGFLYGRVYLKALLHGARRLIVLGDMEGRSQKFSKLQLVYMISLQKLLEKQEEKLKQHEGLRT